MVAIICCDCRHIKDCETMYIIYLRNGAVCMGWGGGRGFSHGLHIVYAWTSGVQDGRG